MNLIFSESVSLEGFYTISSIIVPRPTTSLWYIEEIYTIVSIIVPLPTMTLEIKKEVEHDGTMRAMAYCTSIPRNNVETRDSWVTLQLYSPSRQKSAILCLYRTGH